MAEATDGTLSFPDGSHPKLGFGVFPVIRTEDDHGDVGDQTRVEQQNEDGVTLDLGLAEIVAKETLSIDDARFTTAFLLFTTSSETWDAGFDALIEQSNTVIKPSETLTLYWWRWIEANDG